MKKQSKSEETWEETIEGFKRFLNDYEAQGMKPVGIGYVWAIVGALEMMHEELQSKDQLLKQAIEEAVYQASLITRAKVDDSNPKPITPFMDSLKVHLFKKYGVSNLSKK